VVVARRPGTARDRDPHVRPRQTVRDITSLPQVSDEYVRDVIHAFKERRFDGLEPKPSGGRPRKIGEQIRVSICTIARTSPPTGLQATSQPGFVEIDPIRM
jgi:transposase